MTQLTATSLRSAITTRTAVYSAAATRDIISQGGNLHIRRLSLLEPLSPSVVQPQPRRLRKHVLYPQGLSVLLHNNTCQLNARNNCFQRNNNLLPVRYKIHTPHTL
jgi:hypothetical protein